MADNLSRILVLLSLLFFAGAPGAAERIETLNIDGQAYEAILTPNDRLASAMGPHTGLVRGAHYRGRLPADPAGWVRLSHVEGRWSGLAYLFGQLHRLGGTGDTIATLGASMARAPLCGVDDGHEPVAVTTSQVMSPAMMDSITADFDSLCTDQVNGKCLLMELELAFDLQFQADHPNSFQDRAVSIMNMVEGFYEAQLGIVFDTLSLEFLSNELFSSTTDAGNLLTDITDKLDNDQVPFRQNDQALFHLITGRDFDGGTAGVAWVGTLCDASGLSSATSQDLSDESLTAIVVAHEMGHNLGANHDGDGNACGSGFIMQASVSPGNDSFSSCSLDTMKNQIDGLSAVEQCFNFPADMGLAALAGNPTEVILDQSFQAHFEVGYQKAFEDADRFALAGSVDPDQGILEAVALDGQACTLSGDGTQYDCGDTTVPADGLVLDVQARGTGAELVLTQQVTLISDSGEVKDLEPGNDELVTSFTVAQTQAAAPDSLTAVPQGDAIALAWQDNADNESGFRVERRRDDETLYQTVADDLPADSTQFLDTTIEQDVLYRYRVFAFNSAGDSLPSNSAEAINQSPPARPENLQVVAEGTSARLTWLDTATNETGYEVERRLAGTADWVLLASFPADTQTHLDETLIPEQNYVYRVFAVNTKRSAASDPVTFILPAPPPEGSPEPESEGMPTRTDASDGGDTTGSDSGGGGGGGAAGLGFLLLLLVGGAWLGRARLEDS